MQRTKQQALMFLLGAILVGGVLGFSADRVMSKKPQRVSARMRMYDDIGIAPDQRVKMDSVLDETNCKTQELMKSVRPAMDSVRAEGSKALLALMTEQQRTAYFAREVRFKAQIDSMEKARATRNSAGGPGDHADRPRHCGGPGAVPGMGGPGPNRGPGGPFFR
jgi:hypothetical protein